MSHDVESMSAWSALQVPSCQSFPEPSWDRESKVVSDSIVHPALDGCFCLDEDVLGPRSGAASCELVKSVTG